MGAADPLLASSLALSRKRLLSKFNDDGRRFCEQRKSLQVGKTRRGLDTNLAMIRKGDELEEGESRHCVKYLEVMQLRLGPPEKESKTNTRDRRSTIRATWQVTD